MNKDDEDTVVRVELIPPRLALPPDEVHPWGLVQFRLMTREEYEREYGAPHA